MESDEKVVQPPGSGLLTERVWFLRDGLLCWMGRIELMRRMTKEENLLQ